ncbi:MAG: dihydroorotase [Pseudomonadales bacterium]|nr:dihydroorotase [Pseudomonadales bacterium]
MDQLTLTRPDDWHVHLRDGDYLADTVRDIARYFGRALVMPNLIPPVDQVAAAEAYFQRITSLIPTGSAFQPLMTLYITPNTTPAVVQTAAESEIVQAFKLYPAGATTNSQAGVDSIQSLYPVFAAMEKAGVPLAVHGEVTDHDIDIFDREVVFIERHLVPITRSFPALRIILEHITTRDAVAWVRDSPANIGATITAHHLLYNRNDMLVGGMKPLYYCLPVLKRNTHQQALIEAATSGDPAFFLGTDSAPHPRSAKENACGCAAGSYTAHAAIELYAEVFAAENALDKLEGFASFHGADFYQLPRNTDTITLHASAWDVPTTLTFGKEDLIPIRSGMSVNWSVQQA